MGQPDIFEDGPTMRDWAVAHKHRAGIGRVWRTVVKNAADRRLASKNCQPIHSLKCWVVVDLIAKSACDLVHDFALVFEIATSNPVGRFTLRQSARFVGAPKLKLATAPRLA